MTDKFEYNPCRACVRFHGYGNRKAVNDCCFRSCARLGAGDNSYIGHMLRSRCGNNCKQCVEKDTIATGRSTCAWRQVPPPLWLQDQMFSPCLRSSGNKEQALPCCMQKCMNLSRNPYGCKLNCLIDYNSVFMKKN